MLGMYRRCSHVFKSSRFRTYQNAFISVRCVLHMFDCVVYLYMPGICSNVFCRYVHMCSGSVLDIYCIFRCSRTTSRTVFRILQENVLNGYCKVCGIYITTYFESTRSVHSRHILLFFCSIGYLRWWQDTCSDWISQYIDIIWWALHTFRHLCGVK